MILRRSQQSDQLRKRSRLDYLIWFIASTWRILLVSGRGIDNFWQIGADQCGIHSFTPQRDSFADGLVFAEGFAFGRNRPRMRGLDEHWQRRIVTMEVVVNDAVELLLSK